MTTVRCTATASGVDIAMSVVDQGAGSYQVLRNLAAGTLSLPVEVIRIRPVTVGNDAALQDGGAGNSRVTAVAGTAVIDACRSLADKVGGVPERMREDWLARRLTAMGLAAVHAEGAAAVAPGAVSGVDVRSHGGLAVEVHVDHETGHVSVRRAFLVADTGRVLNPVAHRGQLEGGFLYGLSQAMFEELTVTDGHVGTDSLREYRLATAADAPPLEIRVLEPDPATGETILSVGELANLPVAPALANAIDDAAGARVRTLPINAERVLAALAHRSG
jgi:CO/xanthine dehydrogenase Mo-binding subunit